MELLEFRGEYFFIEHEARATGEHFSNHAAYLQGELPLDGWTPYLGFDYRDMEVGGRPAPWVTHWKAPPLPRQGPFWLKLTRNA